MGKTTQECYSKRLTKVLQFIDSNLDTDLSVGKLAKVASFSKYHFHRIFKGALDENLTAYVVRRRLERAAFLLKSNPCLNVTQVALQVGFNSPEHFSRSFKDKFGFTARELAASDGSDPKSLKNRKIYQDVSEKSFYHVYEESRMKPSEEFEVEIKELPLTKIAFVSDVFGGGRVKLGQRLFAFDGMGQGDGIV